MLQYLLLGNILDNIVERSTKIVQKMKSRQLWGEVSM